MLNVSLAMLRCFRVILRFQHGYEETLEKPKFSDLKKDSFILTDLFYYFRVHVQIYNSFVSYTIVF